MATGNVALAGRPSPIDQIEPAFDDARGCMPTSGFPACRPDLVAGNYEASVVRLAWYLRHSVSKIRVVILRLEAPKMRESPDDVTGSPTHAPLAQD